MQKECGEGDIWGEGKVWKTKSALLSWVRGGIRRSLWNRSPIKINFINKHRKRIPNPNPRGRVSEVWGAQCALCKKDYPVAFVDVDHKGDSHSLKEIEDIQKFVEGIVLVTEDDLQFACKTCHKIRNHSQKMGVTFEEAAVEKQAIEIVKNKQDKEWLIEQGLEPASNQKKRREQIVKKLLEEIV